jgi:hypothetical protein
MFFLTYGLIPFIIFWIAGGIGIRVLNHGEKWKLAFLLPLYAVYQVMMNLVLIYLVFAFLSKKGVNLRHGGKITHAV